MTSVSNEMLEVNMNKTLSNQKRKLTAIKNKILKARDFHLEAENLSNTEAILTALKSDKKSVKINYEENGENQSYLYDHTGMILPHHFLRS